MKTYEYLMNGPDQYLVIKRWIEDGKPKYKEYNVSFKYGGMHCGCPGWARWNKKCKHIKFILSQLQDKGGVIRFHSKFDWMEHLKYKG